MWNFLADETDFALAYGRTPLNSTGEFSAHFEGELIVIDGVISHSWIDDYDFHRWQPGAEGALTLQQYRGARPFKTRAKWEQPVRVYIRRKNGKLSLARPPIWGYVKDVN